MTHYSLIDRVPTTEEYCRLRAISGLTPRSLEAARAGLPHSFLAVVIEQDGGAVGMGRVIGDGGLFFQLVDIAVDPAHQGKGLGKRIVARLMERLRAEVPHEAYVSLIADGQARHLYAQFGFVDTGLASVGMAQWINPPPRSD